MDASIVDLRYRMKDVLRALERKLPVRILYRGKLRGTIVPVLERSGKSVTGHPFFGMTEKAKTKQSVLDALDVLRSGRLRDI